MGGWKAALTALGLALACPVAASAGAFEDQVIEELNKVRADPVGYAQFLSRERERTGVQLDEHRDPQAFGEAIDYLMRQSPLPPLQSDNRIAAAASEFADSQGPTGQIGHGPNGNLGQRMRGQGVWAGMNAETISYGQPTPHEVVRQLVVDWGVPDRGHREIIFDRSLQVAGAGCGRHAAYGEMCVIDFAGAFPPRD